MIAPLRSERPGGAWLSRNVESEDDPSGCPLCEGREGATPPEVFALAPPGRPADAPGWRARVVPNKFPAFGPWAGKSGAGLFTHGPALGRQEVVVHTPRHALSLAELSGRELAVVAEVWRARADAARRDGFVYVQVLLNEGAAAGATLAHSHSQLVWLPDAPAALERELELAERAGGCLLCRVLAEELRRRTRVVLERDGLVLLCPYASRQPYEFLIAPSVCEIDAFTSDRLAAAVALLAEGLSRLRAAQGSVALNAWLHTSPLGGRNGHWHFEVLPRLTTVAGLELGTEIAVNPLPPEAAAGMLREP